MQAQLAQTGLGSQFLLDAAQRGELVDEVPAQQHQILQVRQGLVQRRGGFQDFHAPEAGEDLGVHAVGLDQQAEGLGEAPRAVRAHGHGLHAIRRQALVQRAVVASGGFEHGALDAVLAQPVARSAPAELVVGEAAGQPAGLDVRVEPALADIDAGDDGGKPAGADDWAAAAPLATLSEFMSCVSWACTDSGPCCPRIRAGRAGRVAAGRPS